MIQPNLSLEAATQDFAAKGRCRIEGFLDSEIAEQLYKVLSEKTEYDVAYACSPTPRLVSAKSWRAMDATGRRALQQQLTERASEGQGYVYCTFLRKGREAAATREPEFLEDVFSFWRGDSVRQLVHTVTGLRSTDAESQFTRYTAGQYLTRHRDALDGNKRQLAFVLSLSKQWHPDWGGLLHFYEEDGEVQEVWTPALIRCNYFISGKFTESRWWRLALHMADTRSLAGFWLRVFPWLSNPITGYKKRLILRSTRSLILGNLMCQQSEQSPFGICPVLCCLLNLRLRTVLTG